MTAFAKRTATESTEVVETVEYISVDKIIPNRFQPRKFFNDKELEDLADSIDQNGLLQPISVRRIEDDEQGEIYELIAGERRWRAHKLLGKARVKAIVHAFDDNKSAALALIENLQRADLSAMEEAYALRQLMDMYGYNAEKMAKKIGKSRSYVANSVKLIELPEDVQAMLSLKKLEAWHGITLSGIKDKEVQSELAHKAVEKEWSVSDLRAAVDKFNGKDPTEKAAKKKGLVEVPAEGDLETETTRTGPKHPVPNNYILIKVFTEEEFNDISESLRQADLTVFVGEAIKDEIKKATSPLKPVRDSVAVKKEEEQTESDDEGGESDE